MDVILWRHAVVLPVNAPDLERQLSENGHLQAAQTAEILNSHLPAQCRILVSPAKRAIQTASALSREFQIVDSFAPGASHTDIIKELAWKTEGDLVNQVIVVVGHQPTMGMTISELLFGSQRSIPVNNSEAYWVSQKIEDGKLKAYLRGVVKPELVCDW